MKRATNFWTVQLVTLLLALIMLSGSTLAANNPGHDSLYIEQSGDSVLTGNLNITYLLTLEGNLYLKSYLDLIANGTVVSSSPSRNTIYGTNTLLEIDAVSGGNIYLDRYGGTVLTGSPSARTDLNVSGNLYIYNPTGYTTLTVGNVAVCLANGTGCPTIQAGNPGGAGGGWTNTTTTTSTSLDVNVDTGTLFVNTTSNKIGIGTTNPTHALDIMGNASINQTLYADTIQITGACCGTAINFNNENMIGLNTITISDGGPSEGIQWSDATWSIDHSPLDRSNAAGNLNLYGTQHNIALWRPTLFIYNAGNYTNATPQNGGGIDFTTIGSGTGGHITLNPRGNTGIGTTNPTSTLQVIGTTNTTYLVIASATAASCDLKAYTNGTVYCGTDATGSGGDGSGGWLNTSTYITEAGLNLNITNSTGGSLFFINATNGRVGIGTNNPQAMLSILQTAGSGNVEIGNSVGQAYIQIFDRQDSAYKGLRIIPRNFSIEPSGTTALFVSDAGKIGVGTSSPNATLHVVGTINATTDICIQGGSCLSTVGASGGGWTDSGTVVRLTTATDFVGIGTATPNRILHIQGTDVYPLINATSQEAALYLNSPTGSSKASLLIFQSGGANMWGVGLSTHASHAPSQFGIYESASASFPRLVIQNNTGYVGIGTPQPNYILDVNGSINLVTANYYRAAGISLVGLETGTVAIGTSQGYNITMYTNSAVPRLKITTEGNVGIGTSNPGSQLDLNGTLTLRAISAPSVSSTDQGRLYYDSTSQKFKISENGSAYEELSSGTVVSARMSRATAQSIASGSTTYIDFDRVDFDTGSIASNTTDNFTIQRAGKYLVQSSWVATGLGAGSHGWAYIYVNGVLVGYNHDATTSTGATNPSVTQVLSLAAGDKVSMGVSQDTGGNINTLTATPYMARMTVTLLQAGSGNGTTQWSDNSTSIYYNGGNVGIGTTGPSSTLQVIGTTNTTYLTIANNTASNCDLKADTKGNVYCGTDAGGSDGTGGWTNSTQNTTTTLNVGIGTTMPKFKLEVNGTLAPTGHLLSAGNLGNSTNYWNNTLTNQLEVYNGGTNQLSVSANVVAIGSNKLYVASTGNVGIGTTTPSSTLQVNGTTNTTYLVITNNTAAGCDLKADTRGNVYCGSDANSGGTITGTGTGAYLAQWQSASVLNNSAIYQLASSIGIGTTTPSSALQVTGNSSLATVTGNVGIGLANPSTKLEVNGTITIQNETTGSSAKIWNNGSGICIGAC